LSFLNKAIRSDATTSFFDDGRGAGSIAVLIVLYRLVIDLSSSLGGKGGGPPKVPMQPLKDQTAFFFGGGTT